MRKSTTALAVVSLLAWAGAAQAQVIDTNNAALQGPYTVTTAGWVSVVVIGGGGGGGGYDACDKACTDLGIAVNKGIGGQGGSGAMVTTFIKVNPGQVISAIFGQDGAGGAYDNASTAARPGGVGGAGSGGGGDGGDSGTVYAGGGGGGGGGAAQVAVATGSTVTAAVVAGGGGGGGGGSGTQLAPAVYSNNGGAGGNASTSLANVAACLSPGSAGGVGTQYSSATAPDLADGAGGGGGGGGYSGASGAGGVFGQDGSTTTNGVVGTHRPSTGGAAGSSCYYATGSNVIYNPQAATGAAGGAGGTSTTDSGKAGTTGRVIVALVADPTTTGAGNSGVAAIPTLGEWAMLLMSGLLAALGLRGLRRRKQG